MKQTRMKSMLSPLLLLVALCLPACNNDDEGLLPEGKYPLTLTASIDKLTLTRADGKSAWAIDDQIAVSVNGGISHKIYNITNASTGAMEANNPKDPCYWIQDKDQRILAWYPANGASETNISNQSAGFAAFDYLTSDGTYNRTSANATLPFKHQMAKVKYTLKTGEGITNDDLSSATVQIYGFTKASFTTGELSGNSNGWITPYATDREALLVPQQMQNEDFIKVTVDGNDFYYTPKDENDANLRSGKQYTYKITVKKTGLEVSVGAPVSWTDKELSGSEVGNVTEAKFRVTLSGSSLPALTNLNGITQLGDLDVYETPVGSNTFSFSYTVPKNESTKGFPVLKGFADVKRTAAKNNGSMTYTFTYTNVRSDLWLEYSDLAEVGDYYYADGTWSPEYISSSSPACIGVVFKVGAGTGDAASNYGDKLPKGIRGYVVALEDANDNAGAWGIRETNVNGMTDELVYVNKYDGYINTCIVRQLDAYKNTDVGTPTANGQYWAFKVASKYDIPFPENTSGWYLPSIGQLSDINALPDRSILIGTAGGSDFKTQENDGRYWSSTEKEKADAWYYQFNGSQTIAFAKSNDGGYNLNFLRPSFVRTILTF